MAASFEKSVKGATKIKLAAPKSKYVEHILVATHAGEAGVGEVFRTLQNRLRDSTWTIVFKSLIIIHLMVREGEPDVTLKFLAHGARGKLAINNFTEVQTQGRNIRYYSDYLLQRSVAFGTTKVDHVRSGEGRFKRLTVDKGLLRETEAVQEQIRALLKCELLSHEPENEITLTAFRLLTMDLLALFHVMNEGTINVLEHYLEMSHTDAERALNIYRTFVRQTDQVVQYLSVARLHEHSTRLEIPKIKHAPTNLVSSLESYLNAEDFESNRRQYLAQKDVKKGGKSSNIASKGANTAKPSAEKSSNGKAFPSPKQSSAAPVITENKGPAPDLIDFFGSIEQNQQPMAQHVGQQYQQNAPFQPTGAPPFQQQAFPPQMGFQATSNLPAASGGAATNPFAMQTQPQQSLQPNYTGAGFGGYTPQPNQPMFASSLPQQIPALPTIVQDEITSFPPQMQSQPQQQQPFSLAPIESQSTNPFRQSMMPNATGATASSSFSNTSGLTRTSTNPFAKQPSQQGSPALGGPSFSPTPSLQSPQSPPFLSVQQGGQPMQPLQPAPTGTNPFARTSPTSQTPSPAPPGGLLVPNATGSTNPFRQSAFVNQQTGQGWQAAQGTMGGLEQLDTIPVFPRPSQAPPAQQQQQQQQWQ